MNFWARTGIDWKPAAAAEAVVALFGLLWMTGLFETPLPLTLARNHAEIRWGLELLRLGLWLVPLALLLRDPRRLLAAARSIWPILLIVALAGASALWSVRPGVTLRGSALLATTTAFGIFFGLRFDARRQLLWIGAALGLMAVGSVAASLAFPDYAVMQEAPHRGLWMGLYWHKNLLARDMALAVAVFAMLAGGRILRSGAAWSLAAICLALIAASGSRSGGLVAAATTATTLLLIRRVDRDRFRMRSWIGAGAALCVAIALAHSTLLEWIGRDATLTGRTVLWAAVAERIGERPWLGYGYDAFWVKSVAAGGPAVELAQQIGWLARHAHNGFLDVALDLGAIGFALFALPLLAYATRIARRLKDPIRDVSGAWPAVFLVYWLLSNLTESPLMRHDHLGWALYVAVVVSSGAPAARAETAAGPPTRALPAG